MLALRAHCSPLYCIAQHMRRHADNLPERTHKSRDLPAIYSAHLLRVRMSVGGLLSRRAVVTSKMLVAGVETWLLLGRLCASKSQLRPTHH